ncbi:hypothetical protein ASPCAL01688 [Aspergillus calidoustus]|uniref:Uncharacterized protein n=1 Tax=Aspergillus calidoustus TaxID=454130 RepID=A0A0U5CLD2_ASPCI|nr:hypothetical protein ASPCAL01688 [Aspergillus calidoustus]
MEQFRGRWVIDKARSTGTDGILKLQGVPWALRKAVSVVTVTLDVTLFPKASPNATNGTATESERTPPVTGIEIQITATGGLAGTKHLHVLDWMDDNDDVYPDIQMKREVADGKGRRFLRGEILEDGTASKWSVGDGAPEEASWVHTFIWSVPEKWTLEQVWGFEEIDGHLCHARRFVAVDKQGEYVLGRAIYKRVEGGSESKK